MAGGKIITKRGKGGNIIFSVILRMLDRISSGQGGESFEEFLGGEEYQVVGNFINPCSTNNLKIRNFFLVPRPGSVGGPSALRWKPLHLRQRWQLHFVQCTFRLKF